MEPTEDDITVFNLAATLRRGRHLFSSIPARAGNRCDDGGCIHRSLNRISLFFCLRDRPGLAGARTLYRQETLRTSCLPWLSPHALETRGKVQAPNLSDGTIVVRLQESHYIDAESVVIDC